MKFLKKLLKIFLVLVIVIAVLGFFGQKKQKEKRREEASSSSAWDKGSESSRKETSKAESVKKEESPKKEESVEEPEEESEEKPEEAEEEPVEESEEESEETSSVGIRPDVKEAIDAYEAFIDEYCDLIVTVAGDPTSAELLAAYTEYMQKYEEEVSKMDALEKDLTDEELIYYSETMGRCEVKLLEATAKMELASLKDLS